MSKFAAVLRELGEWAKTAHGLWLVASVVIGYLAGILSEPWLLHALNSPTRAEFVSLKGQVDTLPATDIQSAPIDISASTPMWNRVDDFDLRDPSKKIATRGTKKISVRFSRKFSNKPRDVIVSLTSIRFPEIRPENKPHGLEHSVFLEVDPESINESGFTLTATYIMPPLLGDPANTAEIFRNNAPRNLIATWLAIVSR